MHRHIKIVAVLLIIEGVLEVLTAIFLCVMGPFARELVKASPSYSAGGASPELLGGMYITMGVITLFASIPKIVGGIRNLSMKGRTLGFVALGSSLVSLASCYCTPTALGVGIYGLIVYVNERSAQAFKMAESGVPPEQIIAQLDAAPMGYPPPQYPPYPPA